jgi:hypothetical protein
LPVERGVFCSCRLLRVRPASDDRLNLGLGTQAIRAEGRYSAARQFQNTFTARAERFGAQIRVWNSADDSRAASLLAEVFQGGEGRATDKSGYALFPAPRATIVGLRWRDGARYAGVDAGVVSGGVERAQVVGLVAGRNNLSLFHNAGRLTLDLASALYVERHSGNSAFRPFASATLAYRPASWARFEAGVAVAPNGFAVAGTPLTGLSRFLLYQPGGAAQELTQSASGYGTLRFVAEKHF